jgi:hypothetical protein
MSVSSISVLADFKASPSNCNKDEAGLGWHLTAVTAFTEDIAVGYFQQSRIGTVLDEAPA